MNAAEKSRKKMLLRTQVQQLILSLRQLKADSDVPLNAKYTLTDLFGEAVNLFGEEVNQTVTAPPSPLHYAPQVLEVRMSAESLRSYLDFNVGDPIALGVIGDTLESARWCLKQDLIPCAVLFCRVAQEQTMRRLCDRHGIAQSPTAQAGTLAEALREKNGGPWKKHEWFDVTSRLSIEGPIIHGEVQPDREQVLDLIAWTDKFIDRSLSR